MITIERPIRFGVFLLVIFLLLAALAWLIGRFLWGSNLIIRDGDLTIAEGSNAPQVWQQAVDQGFTSSALPWRYYAWRGDAANQIKAGKYHLSRGEAIPVALQRLIAGESLPDDLTITFPEGFTLDQIAARLAARGLNDADEIIQNAQPAVFADQFPFLADLPPGRDLEGYLFPDTYRFASDASTEAIIQRLIANFSRRLTPELRAAAAASGRSLDNAVIMASIIEREVQSDDDLALVAGILWKRLDEEQGLAADATLRYALKKWDEPLTVADLELDSPYNTRKYRGLPPGPISNPGLRALQAAASPTPSEYYYYLSAPNGKTIFARTNDEHNANKAQYLR